MGHKSRQGHAAVGIRQPVFFTSRLALAEFHLLLALFLTWS